jgi:acetyl esterase/lipase
MDQPEQVTDQTAPRAERPVSKKPLPPIPMDQAITRAEWAQQALGDLALKHSHETGPEWSPPRLTAPAPRAKRLAAAPKGSSAAKTYWGKALSGRIFGSPADRRGERENPDDIDDEDDRKALLEEIAQSNERRARIDDQYKLGSAAKVEISSAGGRELDGNFFSADSNPLEDGKPDLTRPVVLCLSGSGGTAEDLCTDIAEFYQDSGASVLVANYGGYGNSTPIEPSEQSLLEDGQAMLQHLLDLGYRSDQIVIHGFSLGGAVGGILQAHNEAQGEKFRGVVLDRPLLSTTVGVKAAASTNTLRPGMKVVAAVARSSVGKLSARKAIDSSDSDTRIVVSSDKEGLGRSAEKFRKRFGPGSRREVQGAPTKKEHLDTEAMIKTNGAFLRELVEQPRLGAVDVAPSPDPRRPTEKMTATGLRRMISERIGEIESDTARIGRGLTEAYKLSASLGASSSPGERQAVIGKYRELLGQIQALLEEAAIFLGAPDPSIALKDKERLGGTRATLVTCVRLANEGLGQLGEAPSYSPEAIDAMLEPVREAKADLDRLGQSALTGATRE